MNYFSRGSFQRLFTLFVMGKSFPFISEIDYIELVVILFILPSKQTLGKRPQLIPSSARIKGTLNPVYLKGNLFYLIFFTFFKSFFYDASWITYKLYNLQHHHQQVFNVI